MTAAPLENRTAPVAAEAPPATVARVSWTLPVLGGVIALLYGPLLALAAQVWFKDDKQSHGVFVLPAVAGLLYAARADLRRAAADDASRCGARSRRVGLALLGCALLVQVFAHVLGLEAIPLATLPFVLCGAVLVLWGRATLRVAAFPLLFLLFAVPIPDAITLPASAHVQRVSTSAAAFTLTTAGMPVAQTGNRLDTPTLSVEVADVCSGFKKLTALVAFSLLFGHAFGAGWGRRAALLAATYPIALVANCVRICALVGIGSRWGQHALEAAHDGAEFGVLLLAFALFVAFGRGIGCRDLKIRL